MSSFFLMHVIIAALDSQLHDEGNTERDLILEAHLRKAGNELYSSGSTPYQSQA